MTGAKYKFVASIFALFFFGAVLFTPVRSTASPWIEVGKYSTYRGVHNEPMLVKPEDFIGITVECSWNTTELRSNEITVTSLHVVAIEAHLDVTGPVEGFCTSGGSDFFGVEQDGYHTCLWLEEFRGAVVRYHVSDTGLILALDLGGMQVTVGTVQWDLCSSSAVSVKSANVADAFGPADLTVILVVAVIALAVILILATVLAWRRRQQKRWLAAYARATTPVQLLPHPRVNVKHS